ncbi:Protein of unknown function, partial [Gryllus bimaculatus]
TVTLTVQLTRIAQPLTCYAEQLSRPEPGAWSPPPVKACESQRIRLPASPGSLTHKKIFAKLHHTRLLTSLRGSIPSPTPGRPSDTQQPPAPLRWAVTSAELRHASQRLRLAPRSGRAVSSPEWIPAIVRVRMMRSGCTCAPARASIERRWIALVALLLAWGTDGGAAPRGFPCNESWVVRTDDEVQVELRVPQARVAWDPCDATCVWRVRATEEWEWLSLRFARPFEGPDIDFVPEGEASNDGSRGNSAASSRSSEDKAEGGGEGGAPLHLELEVRWPRPDGSWLRTQLRDYSLESVSRMRVPASRAELTLRDPSCAEEPPASGPAPAPSPPARSAPPAVGVGPTRRAPPPPPLPRARRRAAPRAPPPPCNCRRLLAGCFAVACVSLLRPRPLERHGVLSIL